MREHSQGLGISLLLHGSAFAVVWALSASVITLSRPLEIDFGMIKEGAPCSVDQPKHIQAASAAEGKRNVARKHIIEQQHPVEQPQVARPLPPSTSETAVPVQAPKQVAEIGGRSQNSEIMTGAAGGYGTGGKGTGGNGTGKGSSSSGSGTIDNVPFGSVLGPGFVHQEMPAYPFVARRMNKEGKVLLRLTIDELGKLLNVEVVEGAGFGLTEAALEAVKKSTYRPAKKNGSAVISRALLPVSFELTK